MIDAMRSPPPGRELAARGRDGKATALLAASVPLSRREARARAEAAPDAPDRAAGRGEIVASII
jgi:hypothetical protein